MATAAKRARKKQNKAGKAERHGHQPGVRCAVCNPLPPGSLVLPRTLRAGQAALLVRPQSPLDALPGGWDSYLKHLDGSG